MANLESRIHDIVARFVTEIASAVRQSVAKDVLNIIGASGGAKGPAAGTRGRKAAAPVAKPAKRGGGTAGLDRVLDVIGRHPGVRTGQIYAQAGVPKKTVRKALAKLRASGAVKTEGEKRGTTYRLSSGGAALAAAAPAKRRGRPPGSGAARSQATAKKPSRTKSGRGFRSYTEADLSCALDVIKAKPGLRPSEYRVASKLDERVWENVIFKLKSDGRVKVTGKARNTSYVVA